MDQTIVAMRRRSFRGTLLVTTTVIGALALGLPPEPEFLTPLPGSWASGLVVFHQPDFDPERPLATLLSTTGTTAAGGGASAIFYDVGIAAENLAVAR